ncbi:MAG: class I SAM-dependent methyltransferase [Rhizobiales bacterium]|nr:class I SAM-dependent methyltransferase [Hyphomicrobiales bacterium]
MKLPTVIRKVGKRVVGATPLLRRAMLPSTDYRVLDGIVEARHLLSSSSGWLSARTAKRQDRAYQNLIAAMKRGEPRIDLKIAAQAVTATGLSNPSLLEVGCGSGYYSAVFDTMLHGAVRYSGADYSEAMIARARAAFPKASFEVADATRLPYAAGAFDIVFNGVSLMHILEYEAAIREAARVATDFCIFHSVPVFHGHATLFLTKYAYGAPVIEIVYDKQELMSLCADAGLHLEQQWPSIPYDVYDATGHHSTAETYLFSVRKTAALLA